MSGNSGAVSEPASRQHLVARGLRAIVCRRTTPATRLAWLGASLLILLAGLAALAPVVARDDPLRPSGRPYLPPSAGHLLGTDDVGHDIFAQLAYGARISLSVGAVCALLAVVIGLVVAMAAGYLGGGTDSTLMRLVDLALAFPFLPLVLVLATFLGRGLETTVLVIAAVLWAHPARVLRSQVLKVRELAHVESARAMGGSHAHVILRHVLPRVAPLAVAQFVQAANVAVLIEASLAFLGLGDPNQVSWGTMLFFANAHSAFLTNSWVWWVLPPGLALTAAIVGIAFLGYGVEVWADPRLADAASIRSTNRHLLRVRRTPKPAPGLESVLGHAGSDAVLTVEDLTIGYRDKAGSTVRAVDDVSFSVRRGKVVALVGESGSGKTTLAMSLLRLIRPPGRIEGGRILLDGEDLLRLGDDEMREIRGRRIGLVPQNAMNSLNPARTVLSQVAEATELTRKRSAALMRAAELLERVGVASTHHGSFPHQLSGGMRQRVALAIALANSPALLVADEPVTGLDVIVQARVLRLLLDLQATLGLSMLVVSHDLTAVSQIADEVLVMYAGRIVERGPVEQVLTHPHHPYTQLLLRARPVLDGPQQSDASGLGEFAAATEMLERR